jgi:uncharacterized protein
MSDATLVVLAKEPVPGRVKTRLCPPCSPDQAAAIAEAALARTLQAAVAVPGVRPVLALDGRTGPWSPAGLAVIPQVDGDLGARLAAVFGACSGPVVLVGMDTPQVSAPQLRAVVDDLVTPGVDAVLGPTVDGGWWVLGVRTPRADLFVDVPMSHPSTGRRQRERLDALGLNTVSAPTTVDVDDFEAARHVAGLLPDSDYAAAVTRVARSLSGVGR